MKLIKTGIAIVVGGMLPLAAFADDASSVVQRDVNQQQRIEQGLKSGELTTREAAKLEREESRVDKMEANALKDGKLTDQEKRRLDNAQDRVSRDIYREKHDAQTGDPNTASAKRMEHDVQRNVNQERRIEQGVQSGQLTDREAAKLERGQAHVDRAEAQAGKDGNVGRAEQRRIQSAENRQSRKIHREKHDGQRE